MKMTAAELERYRASLNATADDARLYVLGRLRDEASDLSVAEARDLAIEIVEDATGVYGDQAQAIAAELFDEIMEADGASARAQVFGDLIDHAKTESKMHYFACKLVEGDVAGFRRDASDLAAFYVHRSAWDNLVRNCDLNHVMWARIPTGHETCRWCLALAARGFTFHSKAAASHKHPRCKCVVVPGNAGSSVGGFDLAAFKQANASAIEEGNELMSEWARKHKNRPRTK